MHLPFSFQNLPGASSLDVSLAREIKQLAQAPGHPSAMYPKKEALTNNRTPRQFAETLVPAIFHGKCGYGQVKLLYKLDIADQMLKSEKQRLFAGQSFGKRFPGCG